MSHNMAVKTVSGSSSRSKSNVIRKASLPSRSPSNSSIFEDFISNDEDEESFSVRDGRVNHKVQAAKRKNSRPPAGSSPKRISDSSRANSLMEKFTAAEDEKKEGGATSSPEMAVSDAHESDERSYEVEAVVGKRGKGSNVKYEVKWVGYEETTWQPMSDMEGSRKAIEDFEERQRIKQQARAAAKKASPRKPRTSSKSASTRRRSSKNLLLQLTSEVGNGDGKSSNSSISSLDQVELKSKSGRAAKSAGTAARRAAGAVKVRLSIAPPVTAAASALLESAVIPQNPTELQSADTSQIEARSPTPEIILPASVRDERNVSTIVSASPQARFFGTDQSVKNFSKSRQKSIRVTEVGQSGVEIGHNVVMILGHKPKDLTIKRMEDVDFLVNYAGESDNEFVSYETCLRHIPAHVVDYMAHNVILKCSCQHR